MVDLSFLQLAQILLIFPTEIGLEKNINKYFDFGMNFCYLVNQEK